MSSHQATLDGFDTERPDEPDSAPEPGIRPVPNFNREPGTERTQLGADLEALCKRARENEPGRPRGPMQGGEGHE